MANIISSGFTDFPTSYVGNGDKFLRVSSDETEILFTRAELSDLYKVETTGAYLPSNSQALLYNASADRWRPGSLDVYSAGNGINKSGLTLNVVAGVNGGLISNTSGVFIQDINNVAGVYGNTTHIPSFTVNSKGQITAVTVAPANVQTAQYLNANYVGSISSGTANLHVSGSGTNNANVVISLTGTGITPGWYGNVRPSGQIVIPTIDVDSYGRVRQIVEVPIAFDGNGNVIPSSNITSYSVFRVDGQTSIIADSPEDTVSFIAGSGVTITTNAANDSITFSANISAEFNNTSISAFSDVGSLVGIQGDQILIWSNITGKFEYGNSAVGSSSTIFSSDVPPNAPANNSLWYDQVSGRLYTLYDGVWVDASPSGGGLNLLSVNSNILPSANSVYSLGNASLQWKDLSISGNLHLSNVALSINNGQLTVANSALATETFVTTSISNIDLSGYATETFVTQSIGVDQFSTIAGATGTIIHDCALGKVFSHSGIVSNFTANFANLNITTGLATNATLVLTQGATPYTCNAVQISGVAQTILWQGSTSAPSGNANKTDVISFSVMRTGVSTYIVFGQLVSFG